MKHKHDPERAPVLKHDRERALMAQRDRVQTRVVSVDPTAESECGRAWALAHRA